MAIPILVAGLMTAGGFIGGAILRQPEINRLKAQIKILQNEVVKLTLIIEEQKRQISELKIRYDTINFIRVFEKQRVAADVKSQIMHLCSFKEFINLSITRSKGNTIPETHQKFLHAYEMITTGNEDKISENDFDYMVEFIETKYSGTIENMTIPSLYMELTALEEYKG